MFQFAPMALGALSGALTDKDPLTGALKGAGMGAITGGLGALSAPAAGSGASLAAMGGGQGLLASGAAQGMTLGGSGASTGLLAGNAAQGLMAAPAAGAAMAGAAQPAAASGLGGLLSRDGMQAAGGIANLAQQAGIFSDPQGPQAQSAGIPGRGGVDFSGLLSASRANNVSGAQRLVQQRAARRGV